MEHTDHPFPAPAGYDRLVQTIRRRLQGAPLLIAIDGRCGAGKTTLAQRLQQELGGRVFHMDDFFLRPVQRTAEPVGPPRRKRGSRALSGGGAGPRRAGSAGDIPPLSVPAAGTGRRGTRRSRGADRGGGGLRLPPGPVGQLRPAGLSDGEAQRAAAPHPAPQRPGAGSGVPHPLDPAGGAVFRGVLHPSALRYPLTQ